MTVAQYEARLTKLSSFAPQLIVTKEKKALKFQDGLKPYFKEQDIHSKAECVFRGGE